MEKMVDLFMPRGVIRVKKAHVARINLENYNLVAFGTLIKRDSKLID